MTTEQRQRKNASNRRRRHEKRERGECMDCTSPSVKGGRCTRHYASHLERQRVYEHEKFVANREAVFNHYGRACVICGTTENLQIDHIAENGKEHRERDRINSGGPTYRWLVKNNMPQGFQVLCAKHNREKNYAYRRAQRQQQQQQLQLPLAAD